MFWVKEPEKDLVTEREEIRNLNDKGEGRARDRRVR